MTRKLLGAVLVLGTLYVIFFVARDNLSLDDWTASRSYPDVPAGGSEAEG